MIPGQDPGAVLEKKIHPEARNFERGNIWDFGLGSLWQDG